MYSRQYVTPLQRGTAPRGAQLFFSWRGLMREVDFRVTRLLTRLGCLSAGKIKG
jgi:hypothetical protein